jgi:hypothetical protein
MSWPLYIHIMINDHDWVAKGWQAGVVDLALLTVIFLFTRLLYRAVRFFVRGGVDED